MTRVVTSTYRYKAPARSSCQRSAARRRWDHAAFTETHSSRLSRSLYEMPDRKYYERTDNRRDYARTLIGPIPAYQTPENCGHLAADNP